MQAITPTRSTILLLLIFLISSAATAQNKQWTIKEMMEFRSIDNPIISQNGAWIAHGASPDRGDGAAYFYDTGSERSYSIERGTRPAMTPNARWGGAFTQPPFRDQVLAENRRDIPKQGYALISLRDGTITGFENVESATFANNSVWLILHHHKDEKEKQEAGTLRLTYLRDGSSRTFDNVASFTVDSLSTTLVFSTVDSLKTATLSGLDITIGNAVPFEIDRADSSVYINFSWHEKTGRLALLRAGTELDTQDAELFIYDAQSREFAPTGLEELIPDGLTLNRNSRITWREDGENLFIGLAEPRTPPAPEPDKDSIDIFDFDFILGERELDVWHWNDPLIKTHQKETWNQRNNQTFLAYFDMAGNRLVQLADQQLRQVWPNARAHYVVGRSDEAYRQRITWDGRYYDYYLINIETGERTLIESELRGQVQTSPYGRKVAFFNAGHWFLKDAGTGSVINLTENLPVGFANEDDDRPSEPMGYGVAGWLDGDRYVMIYDKFDIWNFDTSSGEATRLTNGRDSFMQFRVIDTEPERDYRLMREHLLLSSYHDREKYHGFYRMRAGMAGTERLLEDKKRFRHIASADDGNRIMYTREDYNEFPDLWVSDNRLRSPKKVTSVNPHISQYNFGKAEMMEWLDMDGKPVQGVVIKPNNYDPNKKYPVLVYFYERFSQRLYHFNEQVVNHRPSFPFYVSDGYVVFLPDIWYTEGYPGMSTVKSLLPGVQKLIDTGIADPNAIGLHGHSWSGYATAYVVTQTDIFAAAVAGAPVSNMTSAYSGIRWGSGLARQFQYETGQSRIGASMWQRRDLYIDNSPVFFADNISTPLLIQFGDKDEAVPWEQGIELYLALRRNGKEAVMLQYRGEPHHLRKYANKLDYTIKMKEFFDHYLKGEDAPEWFTDGVPYQGD